MNLPALQHRMRYDDFHAWEAEMPERWEFVDGEPFMMAGGSDVHNTISGNTYISLRERLRGTPCSVFMSDVKLRDDEAECSFYPDVFVSCADSDRTRRLDKSAPTLIVEVLSPSTEAYDRGRKFAAYRRFASLQALVLLEQDAVHAECYIRAEGGSWLFTEASGLEATLALPALSLALPLAELYRDLPPPVEEAASTAA